MEKILRRAGPTQMSESEVRALAELDKNGDGTVDEQEFVAFVIAHGPHPACT